MAVPGYGDHDDVTCGGGARVVGAGHLAGQLGRGVRGPVRAAAADHHRNTGGGEAPYEATPLRPGAAEDGDGLASKRLGQRRHSQTVAEVARFSPVASHILTLMSESC